jgi:hypothetical protein
MKTIRGILYGSERQTGILELILITYPTDGTHRPSFTAPLMQSPSRLIDRKLSPIPARLCKNFAAGRLNALKRREGYLDMIRKCDGNAVRYCIAGRHLRLLIEAGSIPPRVVLL